MRAMPWSKLAETVRTGVADAGLLVRLALGLSGAALLGVVFLTLVVLRGRGRSA